VVAEALKQTAEYRAETAKLRDELESTRNLVAATPVAPNSPAAEVPQENPSATSSSRTAIDDQVAALEESSQLLSTKVDQQAQTKVESASKYHMRLSGIVLLNLFSNRGMTDSQDVPSYVLPTNDYFTHGSLGATMRQSEIGLEIFGPRIAGAKTSGQIQADFAGGFPSTLNGVNSGLFRLRTASARMDWEHTSIIAGQDELFISPLAPTSFASLAVPAFSYGGNLWAWTPQVRIEHTIDLSSEQRIRLQAGILDNLTGEPPYNPYGRTTQAGERSGQPGIGGRASWTGSLFGKPLTLGTSGYYSRQSWGFQRRITGWASMMDWEIPLSSRFTLSGEFYRGLAIGGLGGGLGQSVIFNGSLLDPNTAVHAINSTGGWSQLKFRATSKLEFNGAFGIDNPYATDLHIFPDGESYLDPTLARNHMALANLIYRPRSNLLFSTEYRHLRTFRINNEEFPADQVNLMMGILF